MSISQHSPPLLRQLSRDSLIAALENADDRMSELQAVLQHYQQQQLQQSNNTESSVMLMHAEELLPAVLSACDVTTPEGQTRKLASLNTLWKLLLALTSSSALSVDSYGHSVQFMVDQLWHGVFSHDWTDTRCIKLAAFFASHLLSAVRAHPWRALTCSEGSLCAAITELFVALAEAVASGTGDPALERARTLHNTVLLRVASAVECLGGAAAAAAAGSDTLAASGGAGPKGAASGGSEEEDGESAAAGGAGAVHSVQAAAVKLLAYCCRDAGDACAVDGNAKRSDTHAALSKRSAPSALQLPRPPSLLFSDSPHVTHAAPRAGAAASQPQQRRKEASETVTEKYEDNVTSSGPAVRAVASLGCFLYAATGVLQQPELTTVTAMTTTRLHGLVRLMLHSLLQWLPSAVTSEHELRNAEEGTAATAKDTSLLWPQLRGVAALVPTSALWTEPPREGENHESPTTAIKLAPPSLRAMWTDCVSRALLLLLLLPPGTDAALPGESTDPVSELTGELVSALATPHPESISLLVECVARAGKEVISSGIGNGTTCQPTEAYTTLLYQLAEVGTVLCAQAAFISAQCCRDAEADDGIMDAAISLPAAWSAPLDLASTLATVVGSCCAVLPGITSPYYVLDQPGAASMYFSPRLRIDKGCFLTLADEVWRACRQEVTISQYATEGSEEAGSAAAIAGSKLSAEHSSSSSAVQLAVALDDVLSAAVEGNASDPAQAVRVASVASALHRLRTSIESLSETEGFAAVETILQHHNSASHHSRKATTSPSATPSPAVHSAGPIQTVLRSFSRSLSTFTRTLTAMASDSTHSGNGLLVAVVAAALVREAAFFPLEEPQDRVLIACVRRWIDLSFLLVDAERARAGLGPVALALARHAAARGLVCFVQNNMGVSMDQLRLPPEAAMALMTLLQRPAESHDGGGTPGAVGDETMSTLVDATAVRQREALWTARVAAAASAFSSLPTTDNTAVDSETELNSSGSHQLLRALTACREVMRGYLDTARAASTNGDVSHLGTTDITGNAAAAVACLRDVLSLGHALEGMLDSSRGTPATYADIPGDGPLVRAVTLTSAGTTVAATRRAAKAPRKEADDGPMNPPLAGDVSQAPTASRLSSSVQLLARSQTSVHSQDGGVDCVHID